MTIFWQPMLDLVEAAKERMPRQGLPALMGPEQALVGFFLYWMVFWVGIFHNHYRGEYFYLFPGRRAQNFVQKHSFEINIHPESLLPQYRWAQVYNAVLPGVTSRVMQRSLLREPSLVLVVLVQSTWQPTGLYTCDSGFVKLICSYDRLDRVTYAVKKIHIILSRYIVHSFVLRQLV